MNLENFFKLKGFLNIVHPWVLVNFTAVSVCTQDNLGRILGRLSSLKGQRYIGSAVLSYLSGDKHEPIRVLANPDCCSFHFLISLF